MYTFIQDFQILTQTIKTNTKYDESFCVFFQIDVHYQFMELFFFQSTFNVEIAQFIIIIKFLWMILEKDNSTIQFSNQYLVFFH